MIKKSFRIASNTALTLFGSILMKERLKNPKTRKKTLRLISMAPYPVYYLGIGFIWYILNKIFWDDEKLFSMHSKQTVLLFLLSHLLIFLSTLFLLPFSIILQNPDSFLNNFGALTLFLTHLETILGIILAIVVYRNPKFKLFPFIS